YLPFPPALQRDPDCLRGDQFPDLRFLARERPLHNRGRNAAAYPFWHVKSLAGRERDLVELPRLLTRSQILDDLARHNPRPRGVGNEAKAPVDRGRRYHPWPIDGIPDF